MSLKLFQATPVFYQPRRIKLSNKLGVTIFSMIPFTKYYPRNISFNLCNVALCVINLSHLLKTVLLQIAYVGKSIIIG